MALIPMEPERDPNWKAQLLVPLLVLAAMAIGATGGLLDMWGRP